MPVIRDEEVVGSNPATPTQVKGPFPSSGEGPFLMRACYVRDHFLVIERTISRLTGYRRLSPRYERYPRNYLAFLGLAAAITCYKRLIKPTK
jgi:hypothetical protein